METIKGKIVQQEITERDPYGFQWGDAERKEIFLSIVLEDAEGKKFYFNTPAAMRWVAFGGGVAVVGYTVENGAAQWLREEGDKRTATKDSQNNNHLVTLTEVGDEVIVRGRLTRKVSKWGREYGVLTHVKKM